MVLFAAPVMTTWGLRGSGDQGHGSVVGQWAHDGVVGVVLCRWWWSGEGPLRDADGHAVGGASSWFSGDGPGGGWGGCQARHRSSRFTGGLSPSSRRRRHGGVRSTGGLKVVEPARLFFPVGVSSAGRGGGGLGQGALGSVTLGDGCFGVNVQVATVTVPFRQQCVAFG